MKTSQAQRLYELLKDGQPHRTDEILKVVYGSEHLGIARPGARVNDLRNGKWAGGKKCVFLDKNGEPCKDGKDQGWEDAEHPTLYWYRMQIPEPNLPKAQAVLFTSNPLAPKTHSIDWTR